MYKQLELNICANRRSYRASYWLDNSNPNFELFNDIFMCMSGPECVSQFLELKFWGRGFVGNNRNTKRKMEFSVIS